MLCPPATLVRVITTLQGSHDICHCVSITASWSFCSSNACCLLFHCPHSLPLSTTKTTTRLPVASRMPSGNLLLTCGATYLLRQKWSCQRNLNLIRTGAVRVKRVLDDKHNILIPLLHGMYPIQIQFRLILIQIKPIFRGCPYIVFILQPSNGFMSRIYICESCQ